MKTVRLITIAILSSLLALNASGKTIYLSDYLEDGQAQTDAMPALRRALEDCRSTHASKLVLPEGRVCIKKSEAWEQYQWISNNDESLKRIAFNLDGMKNFSVEGNNTELIFTGFISPFSLVGCKNITISGITIDYTHTFHSEGVIEAAGDGWLDLRFPDDYRCSITDGCLTISDNEWTKYEFASLLEFDPETCSPVWNCKDYWMWDGLEAEQVSGNVYKIHKEGIKGTVGNVMVLGAAARYCPAFFLSRSSDVTIKDVNIWHCGGMGVIAQMSRNIELDRIKILPAPGSGRVVSITADATHFVNCGGFIHMIDCTFESQKDDATNIHGLYMVVEKIVDAQTLLLKWHNSGQYGVDFIDKGMTLEIVNNKNMTQICRAKVKAVKKINKEYTEVTFTKPLPDGIQLSNVVAADDEYPDVLISGCRFANNRARGLLIGSRGKVIIENSYFHIPGAAILFEGDGNYWFEQSGVRDVTLRGNVFENGNYGYPTWGAACINVGSGVPERGETCYHRNIKIEGNTFRVADPRILNLYSVDGLTFTGNTIEMTDAFEPLCPADAPHFKVSSDCKNINITE